MKLVVGTRGSNLALVQTNWVGLEKKRIYNTRMYYKHVCFINNSLYDNIFYK